MPCDSVILNRVELKVANLDLLGKALASMKGVRDVNVSARSTTFTLNYRSYEIANGKLVGQGSPTELGALSDRIKRAYSKEAVTTAARRYGWIETETSETTATLTKR